MDGVQRNVSHCGETQLGWYRDVPGDRWGCFYGEKVEKEGVIRAVRLRTSPVCVGNACEQVIFDRFGSM